MIVILTPFVWLFPEIIFVMYFRIGRDLVWPQNESFGLLQFSIPKTNSWIISDFILKNFISIISPDYFNLGGLGKIIKKLAKWPWDYRVSCTEYENLRTIMKKNP